MKTQKKGPNQKWNTFFPQIQVKTKKKKKKGLYQKKEHFFPPNSSGYLRSDAHQSQIIGEDADVHHTVLKLLGGYSQIIGGDISPHAPPGFGTPVGNERLLLAYRVFASKSNWILRKQLSQCFALISQIR